MFALIPGFPTAKFPPTAMSVCCAQCLPCRQLSIHCGPPRAPTARDTCFHPFPRRACPLRAFCRRCHRRLQSRPEAKLKKGRKNGICPGVGVRSLPGCGGRGEGPRQKRIVFLGRNCSFIRFLPGCGGSRGEHPCRNRLAFLGRNCESIQFLLGCGGRAPVSK